MELNFRKLFMNRNALVLIVAMTVFGIPAAAKQGDRVLVFNAENQGVACLMLGADAPLLPLSVVPPLPTGPHCSHTDPARNFLVQGQRTELRVYNRKFLSDYSITIEAVTTLTGPKIRNLEEAEGLTLNTPALIPPPTKGGTEGIPVKTSGDFLLMLLDETQAGEAERVLRTEEQQILQRREHIYDEFAAFRQGYRSIAGMPPHSPEECRNVSGAPTASLLSYCMDRELHADSDGEWALATSIYTNERGFDLMLTRVEDLIRAVKTLGKSTSASQIATSAQRLESDVAEYQTWILTYERNLQAAHEAASLVGSYQAGKVLGEQFSMQQMRNKVLQSAKESNQQIDEAQMNQILKLYRDFLHSNPSWSESGARSLSGTLLRHSPPCFDVAHTGFCADSPRNDHEFTRFFTSEFGQDLNNNSTGTRNLLSVALPNAINGVNAAEGRLLSRVNEIYDHSEVSVALPKQIDLNGHSGNLIVYFAIRRVETFKRYSVEQVLGPAGQNAQAGSQVVTLPPPTTGPQPAGNAGTASQPVGNAQGTGNPPSDTTPGTVVARGQFEVHDFYAANVTAAFAYSSVKDVSIIKKATPKGMDPATGITNTCTTDNCFTPIEGQRTPQLNLIIGVDYYFRPRDTFHAVAPWSRGDFLQSFGVMGAISANHANNWFLGLFFEPITGAQFAGGINFGAEKRLQKNFTLGTAVDMAGDFPTEDKRINKAFFSAGLDLALFRKIFGKITGVGAPAKGAPGN